MKENGEDAFTLTAQDIHGVAIGGIYTGVSADTSCEQGVVVPVIWYDKYNCYIAIRKLTPRECFRLQAFTDEEFDKAQFVNSNSQLYKQAGNSVTVSVVYEIGKAIAECKRR